MEDKKVSIVEHFSPAWFASVMGTAAIPLAMGLLESPLAYGLAKIFFVLSIVMAIVIAIPWFMRFILYPHNIQKDFNHPVVVNFFPTMPISLILLSLNFIKFHDFIFDTATSHSVAFILWGLGSGGIYTMGFLIVPHIFKHKEIAPAHANYGWYIPPVSKLLIPVAGFELISLHPQYADIICLVSFTSLGAGFFLFLFVGSVIYQRNIFNELPMPRLAPTFFIGIVPPAIIAIDVYKLIIASQSGVLRWIDAQTMKSIGFVAILINWGFAFWWFVLSLIIVGHYIKNIQLPYALSWWAFTFPLGALSIASGLVAKVTGCAICHFIFILVLAIYLGIWSIVAYKTLVNTISGQVFKPTH